MGAKVDSTILINRAVVEYNSEYDGIADNYNDLFTGNQYKLQDKTIISMLPSHKTVIDVGCGTGLYLDYILLNKDDYIGIDSSVGMINELKKCHAKYSDNVILSNFEDFFITTKKDLLIALFGTASYINPKYFNKINGFCDKYFLMFFRDNYKPVTHIETGIDSKIYPINISSLIDCKLIEFDDFMVATNANL